MIYSTSAIKRAFILLTMAALAATPALGDSITLARQGRPAAAIVIPADASQMAQKAALELRDDIQKIAGVELPIHRDGKAVDGTGLKPFEACKP